MEETVALNEDSLQKLYDEREEHQKKLKDLQKRVGGIIGEKFHSPLFLIVTILMTGIAVFTVLGLVLSIVNNGLGMRIIGSLITSLPTIICSIVAAVASWKMYAAKEALSADKTGGAGAYLGLSKVYGILSCIGIALSGVALVAVVAIAAGSTEKIIEALNEMAASGNAPVSDEVMEQIKQFLSIGTTTILIVTSIVAILGFVIALLWTKAYSKAGKHIKFLRAAIVNGQYDTLKKAPCVLAFIVGGFTVLGGCSSMVFNWTSGLSAIFFGLYMILLAVTFLKIDKAQRENVLLIQAEEQKIGELEGEISAERRKVGDMEKLNEQKRKQEEQEFQAQQRQMMQMMMQMQMRNASQQSAPEAEVGAAEDKKDEE